MFRLGKKLSKKLILTQYHHRRRQLHQQRQQQRGVALLAALILMLAIVLTLGNIFYRHQVDVSRLTKFLHGDQALLLGLSAEAWAIQVLENDNPDVDDFFDEWAVAVPVLAVEGGSIRGCMIDLQSRINLNSFASYSSERWSDEMDESSNGLIKTWLGLLTLLELPAKEEFAVSIIDWTDENSEPFNQWGAEQNNYALERTGHMVANAKLSDVSELAIIKGFNFKMMQALEPWVTALPEATAININTADETLLRAIGGKYSEIFASTVLAGRPFTSTERLRDRMAGSLNLRAEQAILLWPEDLITINSKFFQLNMQVRLGDVQLEIHSIMSRYGREVATVIRRDVAIIPSILFDEDESSSKNVESIQSTSFCPSETGLS